MNGKLLYRIIHITLSVGLSIGICAIRAGAQQAQNTPTPKDLYCSGVVTDQPIPKDTFIASGENAAYKDSFHPLDNIYINRGSDQGVKIGDEFEVIRPANDYVKYKWFKWQNQLSNAMGTTYADIGRLRVVHVLAKTSIATTSLSCDWMERGDIVRPFTPRPAPAYHAATFDIFAPPSGKKMAMIVTTKNFGMISGKGTIVYVNLGSAQGVNIGDYFRVFRYQGSHNETVYAINSTAYKTYGFGSAPIAYQWNDLPRQILGEGIVVRTGPNASTVLLTTTRQEIYDGDYVELE